LHRKPELRQIPPTLAYPKPDTLVDLKNNLSLIDTFRSLHPTAITYTRHAYNSHSRLDRFYTNHLCNPSTHTNLPTPFSDHDPVILSLTPQTHIRTNKLHWKNNINNYIIPEYNFEINEMIETLALNLKETKCNPLQIWQSFKNHLKKIFNKTVRTRIQKTSRRKFGGTAKIGAASGKHDAQPNSHELSNVRSLSTINA